MKVFNRVHGHQNGLLKTDRLPAKLPICSDSNAKCPRKKAIEYGHMRHLYGVQTNRLIITTAIVRSMQNKWAYDSAVRQR